MTAPEITLYCTNYVLESTTVSHRQLHYWAAQGLLQPIRILGTGGKGSGTSFAWTPDEIAVVKRMGQLVNEEKSSPAYAAKIARQAVVS